MSQSQLGSYAANAVEVFGEAGVWGTSKREPSHGLEYEGAWKIGSQRDDPPSAATSDSDDEQISIDGVAALYKIPGKNNEYGRQHYQLWLWAGGRLQQQSPSGIFGDGKSLREIWIGIDFDRVADDMLLYSPSRDYSDSYQISSVSPLVDGPSVEFPLAEGTVGKVASKTRVGERGKFAARWRGSTGSNQAVLATCECSWPAEFGVDFEVELGVTHD